MNIGKFCPIPLCTLIGTFRTYLYIVSLVVILSNWVCDNWVYRFPNRAKPRYTSKSGDRLPKSGVGILMCLIHGVDVKSEWIIDGNLHDSMIAQCKRVVAALLTRWLDQYSTGTVFLG